MSRERFLTIRWNDRLTIGLGIPTLIYVISAFTSTLWTEREGLIGLAAIGVVY